MSEPMTDDDLAAILDRLACRYVFRDEDTGEMWIDGGALQRVDIEALLAEVHRLRDGIRTKAEAWDREEPDAEAFRVTADFRDLIGDAAWSLYERPDGLANEWSE